jgi:two-component system nitrate/nitrite response regulator NarL
LTAFATESSADPLETSLGAPLQLRKDTAPRRAPVRIVIADEHPIFRDGLRRLLETRPDLQIVGETGHGSTAAALVRELLPDILLLGLGSTGDGVLEVVRTTASCGSVGTILLTGCVDTPEVASAFQLGARGVVPKDAPEDALFRGIDSVMDGDYWVGDKRVSNVAGSLRKLNVARRRAKAFGLTRRELDIVRAIVNGFTNKQIAQQSAISESTVKRHVTHIFDKLGASNRIEVALFAAHHRLLDGI